MYEYSSSDKVQRDQVLNKAQLYRISAGAYMHTDNSYISPSQAFWE